MKIFFRYLFLRLLTPFAVCLISCTVIWIMADLYGNIDDFLVHKTNFYLVVYYYLLDIPKMLVQVLPAALLFSTLWTLISLNRRSELVALQSGGMAPLMIFSPFAVFALIWVGVLAFDMNGPAAEAEVTSERLLLQLKGQDAKSNEFKNLPYVDSINHRIWFFQTLDTNKGRGKGEITERDADGHDIRKYIFNNGRWINGSWKLTGVKEIIFAADGTRQDEKIYTELDLPDITTPPKQLSLIVSQPDQLTVAELSRYIATSTASQDHLASYRTEWWYRILHPFSLIVLMLFALVQGTRPDRRSAVAGVVSAIIVLVLYIMVMNVFMAAGRFNRLSPFLAVVSTEVIFGLVGLYLLALRNGWWWQFRQLFKRAPVSAALR
jgi:lipopolysaccharide export system permease protein